jgi:hypothetical protein
VLTHSIWTEAERLHEDSVLDYEEQLDYYMHYGYILSAPDGMIWAEPYQDAWLVYLAIGRGCIPMFLNAMPFWLPRFAYTRLLLRNKHCVRVGNMERICRMYNLDVDSLKRRHL